MNFHTKEWIMEQVKRHYEELLKLYPEDRVLGVFLQGSQNYGLDYEDSDVDTKAIIIPSFEEICLNKKPASFTHILDNEEHLDVKDIRKMFELFRKQNINIIEILFTPYKIINPKYQSFWTFLECNREFIAHYNPYAAVKTMKGVAMEKYYAMKHRYPSKVEIIDKFGYDPKQISHLFRIYWFIKGYTTGQLYEKCLIPSEEYAQALVKIKKGDTFSLETAREMGKICLNKIIRFADDFCEIAQKKPDENMDIILNLVLQNIIKLYLKGEFKDENNSY